MTVVGVDGWKDGWVAAVASGRVVTWIAYSQPGGDRPRDAFARLLADHPGATIAVDIPIGATGGTRRSDTDAAAWLHEVGAQRSSIFPTPSADLIAAHGRDESHRTAMAVARAQGIKGTSIQAWNLIPKIVEVSAALAALPGGPRSDGPAQVVEAHPECSFRALEQSLRADGYRGAPLGRHSKKTAVGQGLRMQLLRAAFDLPDLTDAPDGVPADDLLDACAVAWTARRVLACAPDLRTFPARPVDGEPRIHV